MEKLDEVWETLVTCYNRPEKYTSETLEPIVKFKRYKAPPQAFRYQGILLLAEGGHDRSQRGPFAPQTNQRPNPTRNNEPNVSRKQEAVG
jgi:hypothetical protein